MSTQNIDDFGRHMKTLEYEIDKQRIRRLIETNSNRLSFYQRKNGRSFVWRKFVRIYVDNEETHFVKCVDCNDVFKNNNFTGTGSLLRHNCFLAPINVHSIAEESAHNQSTKSVSNEKKILIDDILNGIRVNKNNNTNKSLSEKEDKGVTIKIDGNVITGQRFKSIDFNVNEELNISEVSDNADNLKSLLPDVEFEDFNDKNFVKHLMRLSSNRLRFGYKKGKSEVWLKFERVFIDNRETMFVKCKTCHDILKYVASTGTGSLLRHNCHLRPFFNTCGTNIANNSDNNNNINKCVIESITSDMKPVITDNTINSMLYSINKNINQPNAAYYKLKDKNYGLCSTDKEKIANNIVLCSALESIPIRFFDSKHFNSLVRLFVDIGATYGQHINLHEILPTLSSVEEYIDINYGIIKHKLINEIEKLKYLGLTGYYWNERSTDTNFISAKIQYIKDETICVRLLNVIEVSDKSDSETILECLNQIIDEFSITNKAYIIVTENSEELSATFESCLWIGCSYYNLNQVLKHSFSEDFEQINRLLWNCRHLMISNKSYKNELKAPLIEPNEDNNNLYEMLDSIMINLEILKENTDANDYLASIDEQILKSLIELLKQIKEAKDKLCSKTSPTLHLLLPIKQYLISYYQNYETNHEEITSLKENLINNINKYLLTTNFHLCATFLTPAVRKLKKLVPQEKINDYLSMISHMADEIKTENNENTSDQTDEELPIKLAKLDDCLSMFAEASNNTNNDSAMSEVLRYYNCPFSNEDLNLSPITFWHKYETEFPRLFQLFLYVFSVPATNLAKHENFNLFVDLSNDANKFDKLLVIRCNYDLL